MIERAQALLALRRPREAIEHLQRALAAEPENAHLHCLVAWAQLELEDFPAALRAADAAIATGPGEEWGHRLRAVTLTRMKRPDEAVVSARAAVRLAPEWAMTHATLARATSDHDEAVAAARRAVELDPDDADTHATLGDVLAERRETLPQALTAYRTALAIDPENTVALNNLAVARLTAHENDRGATAAFEQALMLDPTDAVARRNLLRSGDAGDVYACRRVALGLLVPALILVFVEPLYALAWLALPALLEVIRAILLRRLSPPVRQMVLADVRARRRRLTFPRR
jgi:tetratricopeptide (TPR) repeat protein